MAKRPCDVRDRSNQLSAGGEIAGPEQGLGTPEEHRQSVTPSSEENSESEILVAMPQTIGRSMPGVKAPGVKAQGGRDATRRHDRRRGTGCAPARNRVWQPQPVRTSV